MLHLKCSICRRPMLAVVRQAVISESAAATGQRANRGALATACQSANRRTDARAAGHNCDRFSRRPSAPHFAPLPICPRLLVYHSRPHHAHTVPAGIGRWGISVSHRLRACASRGSFRAQVRLLAGWRIRRNRRGTRTPRRTRVCGVRRRRRKTARTSGQPSRPQPQQSQPQSPACIISVSYRHN